MDSFNLSLYWSLYQLAQLSISQRIVIKIIFHLFKLKQFSMGTSSVCFVEGFFDWLKIKSQANSKKSHFVWKHISKEQFQSFWNWNLKIQYLNILPFCRIFYSNKTQLLEDSKSAEIRPWGRVWWGFSEKKEKLSAFTYHHMNWRVYWFKVFLTKIHKFNLSKTYFSISNFPFPFLTPIKYFLLSNGPRSLYAF